MEYPPILPLYFASLNQGTSTPNSLLLASEGEISGLIEYGTFPKLLFNV